MSRTSRPHTPRTAARQWLRYGVLAGMALFFVGGGFAPAKAHAQKTIDFFTTGSVASTLQFSNQIYPDVYTFHATAGERLRVETSNNTFDTTVRVIGPDAALNLFDDDSGVGNASRLVFTAADTGAYIVVVSSFSGNPVIGEYRLNFARGTAALQSVRALRAEPDQGNSRPELANEIEVKEMQERN